MAYVVENTSVPGGQYSRVQGRRGGGVIQDAGLKCMQHVGTDISLSQTPR